MKPGLGSPTEALLEAPVGALIHLLGHYFQCPLSLSRRRTNDEDMQGAHNYAAGDPTLSSQERLSSSYEDSRECFL